MSIERLLQPLKLQRGPNLRNKLLLAPLTNWQCNDDGTVTDREVEWLTRCAAGGFSVVMTCAANVHEYGKAFPGQMGIYSDKHIEGLRKVANVIRANGGVSSVQLHHGGVRVNPELGGTRVGPSDIPSIGARGLSLHEVGALRDAFITAALRAQTAGFDGVEVHAAFGWILMQFLSPDFNKRQDGYGGSFENRCRFLFEVIDGIRMGCRPDFQIGLRISMERYGMRLAEVQQVAARAMKEGQIDYLDLALWDYKKEAQEEVFKGQPLLSLFTGLPRYKVRLGASGKIMTAQQAVDALDAGCDFVMLGKAAVLCPDFPQRLEQDAQFQPPRLPVTPGYLLKQGLSERFIEYMKTWDGFVCY